MQASPYDQRVTCREERSPRRGSSAGAETQACLGRRRQFRAEAHGFPCVERSERGALCDTACRDHPGDTESQLGEGQDTASGESKSGS